MSKTWKFQDGDIVVDRNKGRAIWITGMEKATQDVAFTLMTATDLVRRIGCALHDLDNLSRQPQMVKMRIQQEVTDGVQRLMDWQALDSTITPAERLLGIDQVVVVQDGPNSYVFNATLSTADRGGQVPLSFRVLLGQQFRGQPRAPTGFQTDDTR